MSKKNNKLQSFGSNISADRTFLQKVTDIIQEILHPDRDSDYSDEKLKRYAKALHKTMLASPGVVVASFRTHGIPLVILVLSQQVLGTLHSQRRKKIEEELYKSMTILHVTRATRNTPNSLLSNSELLSVSKKEFQEIYQHNLQTLNQLFRRHEEVKKDNKEFIDNIDTNLQKINSKEFESILLYMKPYIQGQLNSIDEFDGYRSLQDAKLLSLHHSDNPFYSNSSKYPEVFAFFGRVTLSYRIRADIKSAFDLLGHTPDALPLGESILQLEPSTIKKEKRKNL